VPALPDFREAMPEIEVELSYVHEPTGDALAAADLLIVFADGIYRGPGHVHLTLDGSVRPVCSPSYRKRLPDDISPADLLKASLLHDASHDAWKRWFGEAGLPFAAVPPGTILADFGLLGVAALAGHGVALCPKRLIEPEISGGDLVFVSNLETLTERRYCLILPDKPAPEAMIFAEWLSVKGWQ
jgi:LysR family glycine cleavage system transcriptional activator